MAEDSRGRATRPSWRNALFLLMALAALGVGVAVVWRSGLFHGEPDQKAAQLAGGTADTPPTAATPVVEAPVTVRPEAAVQPSAVETPPPPPKPPIERVKALFQAADVPYPPKAVILAAFKEERELELYARARKGGWRFVHRYPIVGASGAIGPKLQEGDRQVPEGIYSVIFLNPNSKFHLSMRLDYPNAFDRKMAEADKRTKLGGDIMIHGGGGSTGCLAMGDPAIEEIYALTSSIGIKNVKTVIAPFDLRLNPSRNLPQKPDWLETLYEKVADELARLPVSPKEMVAEAMASGK